MTDILHNGFVVAVVETFATVVAGIALSAIAVHIFRRIRRLIRHNSSDNNSKFPIWWLIAVIILSMFLVLYAGEGEYDKTYIVVKDIYYGVNLPTPSQEIDEKEIGRVCDGKLACDYPFNAVEWDHKYGDPAPTIVKDIEIEFYCGNEKNRQRRVLKNMTVSHGTVHLDCMPQLSFTGGQ